MIRVVSWALVESVDEGTVLHKEYETEAEAVAALWKMLDDASNQEQRDWLSDVLSVEKR